jgi:hypothetical protein
MESSRNLATGDISVRTKKFVAVVSEDAVRIQIGGAVVHEWAPGTPASVVVVPDRTDTPSARSRPKDRKRGTR